MYYFVFRFCSVFVRFIRIIVYSCGWFFLVVVEYSSVWICTFIDPCIDLSIHSTISGHLDDLPVFKVRNSAFENTSVFLLGSLGVHYSWGYAYQWNIWVTAGMHVQLYEILSVSLKGCTNLDFGQQCMSTLLPYILSILSISCPFHFGHAGGSALLWCWDFKLTLCIGFWRTWLWAFVLCLPWTLSSSLFLDRDLRKAWLF